MRYMMLIYLDEKTWWDQDEAEREQRIKDCQPQVEALRRSGKYLAGAPLQPTATATTVRSRDGKRLVTDGPFAETREQLGGFNLIEARDLDEAIELASGFLNRNELASIEIRPLVPLPWAPAYEGDLTAHSIDAVPQ